jgi:serine/threonine protein kinase
MPQLQDSRSVHPSPEEIIHEKPHQGLVSPENVTIDDESEVAEKRTEDDIRANGIAPGVAQLTGTEVPEQREGTVPAVTATMPQHIDTLPLRKQHGAGDCGQWASRMKLSEFHRRNCKFQWPKSEPQNPPGPLPNSIMLNDNPIPLTGFLGNINSGEATSCIVSVWKINEDDYGFDDTLVLKDIRCRKKEEQKSIIQEAEILKSLNHNHVIAFLGAFHKTHQIGILMFPAASYNLRTFMETISEHNEDPHKTQEDEVSTHRNEHVHVDLLRHYFACLCQGLLYLHEKMRIKHKDIKPDNILIDRYDSVIITDFGVSTQHMGKESAVTMGDTRCTVQYAAPEIGKRKERDLNIDIFSLGCVFLEMANVIYGETFQSMYKFLRKPIPDQQAGQERVNYFDCPQDVSDWVTRLRQKEGPWTFVCNDMQYSDEHQRVNDKIFDTILKMMATDPKERPQLKDVWSLFDSISRQCADCHPDVSSLDLRSTATWLTISSARPARPTEANTAQTSARVVAACHRFFERSHLAIEHRNRGPLK